MNDKTTGKFSFSSHAALALAVVVLAIVAFSWTSPAAEGMGQAGTKTDVAASPGESSILKLTGTIEAIDKPVPGSDSKVRIVSPEKGAFPIANSGKGQELVEHVGATVVLTARRTRDGNGHEILTVQSYQIKKS